MKMWKTIVLSEKRVEVVFNNKQIIGFVANLTLDPYD
jgi:hypothetical protein